MRSDTLPHHIPALMNRSWAAFETYREMPLKTRAALMYAIAAALEAAVDALVATAMRETHLPEARLRNELSRTTFQLRSYADACEQGDWLSARIDTALPDRQPPRPDIRKMNVPLGPVVVYGSSNFPFAYSTAGGDTACALAAGCSVVVKAHPAHPDTSDLTATLISEAVYQCGLPEDLFLHVHASDFETGRALIQHPATKAVGFTGSYTGGRALFDWANQRPDPIPVFAEMGSVNPVFLLPEKLEQEAEQIASLYAGSITLGVGQFCTNPGLIIAPAGEGLDRFTTALKQAIEKIPSAPMLHDGIVKAFRDNQASALAQEGTRLIATGLPAETEGCGTPAIAMVEGAHFLNNRMLHQEVFGPFSLIVRCKDMNQVQQIARQLEGQLTATLMATETDMRNFPALLSAIRMLCGRCIFNGVPTGVEVCLAMQHGGPFPASTDSRFGAVGADAIRRFVRPLAFQNWPDALLPDPLKNGNPLGIWRTVNNEQTREAIGT